ncbi:MAG: PorV/PorQ family protein [candidate division WOR-3 bacterium]
MNINFLKFNIKLAIIALCISAILVPTINAIDVRFSKVGTTAAQFLKIGVGRATGMGEAFSAISDDASATYFNPSGLTQLRKREVLLNHIDWIADINHDYLAVAMPTNWGVLALSFTALTMGQMQRLTIDDPKTNIREDDSTGLFFNCLDMAIGVSYARQITEKLSFGLTTKVISQSVWNMSANGVGFDFGLLYYTGFKTLRLAACISNFGSSMSYSGLALEFIDPAYLTQPRATYKTEPRSLPTYFRFGLAYDIIDMPTDKLTFACDVIHPNDINETVNFGLEYMFRKIFYLRGGYIFNTDTKYGEAIKYTNGLSGGLGVAVDLTPQVKLRLDYCYRDLGWLKGSHRVGAIVGF